jgi:hypothetical protein
VCGLRKRFANVGIFSEPRNSANGVRLFSLLKITLFALVKNYFYLCGEKVPEKFGGSKTFTTFVVFKFYREASNRPPA